MFSLDDIRRFKSLNAHLYARALYRCAGRWRYAASAEAFCYRRVQFPYFQHWYNNTAITPRAVEVPIAMRYMWGTTGRVLEVGNVLSHYFPCDWDVVDALEKGPHVINADIMRYSSAQPYDVIVSVSTLEHIAFGKHAHITNTVVTLATILRHLRSLLVPAGAIWATVPIGYNPRIDQALKLERTGADHVRYMRQTSDRNTWKVCGKKAALSTKWGNPWTYANGLAILEIGDFDWEGGNL